MNMGLAGKRAFVTGSSSGIGEAIALMLGAEGAYVVTHGRDVERANRTAEKIRAAGGTASAVTGDLTDLDQVSRIAEKVSALGTVDILVNNAGGRQAGWAKNGWFGQTAEVWLQTYKQNVLGTAMLIDHFVPRMVERGWGRVIQITSAIALHQPPLFPDYQAAKAAEINLSRSLSRSLAGTGVTSNCISAGIILSPGSEGEIVEIAQHAGLSGNWRDHERHIALNIFRQTADRVGRPDDIASAVTYLAGDRGEFVTGVNLVIDGGI